MSSPESRARSGPDFFADIAHVVGLVVAGLHENPTPVSDVVSTSTHKTFCGPRTGGLVLCRREHAKAIDDAIFPAMQGAPGAHIIAGRAVLFGLAASEGFRELMQAVTRGAKALAASLERAGLPLYLGGTDTHMVILDLRDREVEGRAAERRLERHGLVANRVTLPEKLGARSRVGIRLGTTAMATRGMREEGFAAVGALIAACCAERRARPGPPRGAAESLLSLFRSPPRSAASKQCRNGAIDDAIRSSCVRGTSEGPQGHRRRHDDRRPSRRDAHGRFRRRRDQGRAARAMADSDAHGRP